MAKTNEQLTELQNQAEFQEFEKSDLFLALSHPKFLRGVRSVARHARNNAEGGLAAYKTARGIAISAPSIALPEDIQKHSHFLPISHQFSEGYRNFNPSGLIGDSQGHPREDILLLLHSHPLRILQGNHRPQDVLCPSVNDIDLYEKLDMLNPHHVQGVLVAKPQEIDLLLYSRSRTRDFMQYYKRFERVTNPHLFLQTLQESGFNMATIQVSKKAEVPYEEQVAQAVSTLVS